MKFNEINFNMKLLLSAILLALLMYVIYQSSTILLIILISVLISYILNPIIEFLERHKINRTVSVLVLTLLFIGIITMLLLLIIPILLEDAIHFANNLEIYINNLFIFSANILDKLDINISFEYIKTFIMERISVISSYIIKTVTTASSSIKTVVTGLLNIVLIPMLVFFILKDFPKFKEWTKNVLSGFNMDKLVEFFSEFQRIMSRYFRGMFLVGLILSSLYIAVLMIIGIKHGILLGILTGMGGMVPYIGFAIGLITTLIVTFIQFQDFIHLLYVVIGFSIIQFLESFVITPKIVGDSLGLSPVVVIIGLMIGGALLGLPGMILAIPVAAFIKIMIDRYVINKNDKKNSDNS